MRSADPSKAEAVGGRIRFQAPRKRFKALRDEAATTSRHDTVALVEGEEADAELRVEALRPVAADDARRRAERQELGVRVDVGDDGEELLSRKWHALFALSLIHI